MDFRTYLALMGFLAVILPQPVFPQSVDISGTVRDSVTGEPLPGVVISLASRSLQDTTDDKGEFRLLRSEAEAHRQTPLVRLNFSSDSGFAISLRHEEDVVAEVINGAGRTIARAGYALDAGDWVLRPHALPVGLYTVKLWTGSRLRALRMNIHNQVKPKPGDKLGWTLERMQDGVIAPAFARRSRNAVDSLRAIWKGKVHALVPIESWSQTGLRVFPGGMRTASAEIAPNASAKPEANLAGGESKPFIRAPSPASSTQPEVGDDPLFDPIP
jgi:hypothetical protein